MSATLMEERVATSRPQCRRSGIDRRAGEDRRTVHDLSYFEQGGIERRKREERRVTSENRAGWVRVTQWSSICICDLVAV